MPKKLKQKLFSLPPRMILEPLYREQGRDRELLKQLETIGFVFVRGFDTALISKTNEQLLRNLNKIEPGYRSFAFEGVGMYLGLTAMLFPGRGRRFFDFIENGGLSHNIILTTGAGLALAKMRFLKKRAKNFLSRLDPYLALIPYDSFGFYDAIYKTGRTVKKCDEPVILEIAKPLYDQGIGRSLWILQANDMEGIKETVDRFPVSRRGDLWCGLWFALSFAGGANEKDVKRLWDLGKEHQPHAALGIIQTAHMRCTHGFVPDWTENVCRRFLNMSAKEAADIFEKSLRRVRQDLKNEPEERRVQFMNTIRRYILIASGGPAGGPTFL